MGLVHNVRKAIGNFIAGGKPSPGELKFTSLFPSLPTVPGNWTANRYELAGHFRGWPYVAINAIAQEIACMQPTIANVIKQNQVKDRVSKALRDGTLPRSEILRFERAKYLTRFQKQKSLVQVHGTDEIQPVDSSHPLVQILKKPNPHDTYWTFAYKLSMWLELTGSAYIWDVRDQLGRPCELWPIPSHWVREVPGQRQLIDGYDVWPASGYVPTDMGMGFFPGVIGGRARFGFNEVIAVRYPSPISHIDGYSPMQAIGKWVDVANNMDDSRVQTFANGAFPGVVIEMDPMAGELSPEEGERFKAKILAEWTGVRHTKRPIVLSKGVTLKPFTQPTSELEYNQSSDQMKNHLLAAYRVPQSIAGLVEESTYANAEAAQLNFCRRTIKPKLSLISQIGTEWAKKAYRDDSMLWFWPDPTPEDPDLLLRRQEMMWRTSSTWSNEIREEYGLEPMPKGGDDPPMGMGQTFVGWNSGGAPPMPGAEMQQQQDPNSQQQDPNAQPEAEPAAPDPNAPVDANDIIQKLLNGGGGKNAAA